MIPTSPDESDHPRPSSMAILTKANIAMASFHGANFGKVVLKEFSDRKASTHLGAGIGSDLRASTATEPGVNLTDTDLLQATLTGATLQGAVKSGSSLTGANWATSVPWSPSWTSFLGRSP
jgi:uncharacterized protein YjbI with pentapeptide repeats